MPERIARPEDECRAARLSPTTGIGGPDEQEQRATSSLLAVTWGCTAVWRALLDYLGAPAGKLTTFTEIRFEDADIKLSIPDGATRGRAREGSLNSGKRKSPRHSLAGTPAADAQQSEIERK